MFQKVYIMLIRPIFGPNPNYNQIVPYLFNNAFTTEEIEWIQDLTDLSPYITAGIGDEDIVNDKVRKSSIKWLPHSPNTEWVYDKISSAVLEANNALWGFSLSSIIDNIQYTEYYEDGGHYGWHVDTGNYPLNHRKISITIQLSNPDDYEGGILEFNVGGSEYIEAPKQQGLAVLFPSYLLHRVTPVTKGVRKSLVLWVGGDTFR